MTLKFSNLVGSVVEYYYYYNYYNRLIGLISSWWRITELQETHWRREVLKWDRADADSPGPKRISDTWIQDGHGHLLWDSLYRKRQDCGNTGGSLIWLIYTNTSQTKTASLVTSVWEQLKWSWPRVGVRGLSRLRTDWFYSEGMLPRAGCRSAAVLQHPPHTDLRTALRSFSWKHSVTFLASSHSKGSSACPFVWRWCFKRSGISLCSTCSPLLSAGLNNRFSFFLILRLIIGQWSGPIFSIFWLLISVIFLSDRW